MTPLSEQQRLFYVETTQLYEAWRDARRQAEVRKYGMKWVTAKGRQYLVKLTNARGNGKSLGPRSPETEALLAAFQEGKLRADRRLGHIRERLEQQARLNRALRMGRLPSQVAAILGAIDRSAARDDFRVVGTHALYAYEALAGVQIRMELLASGDRSPRLRLPQGLDRASAGSGASQERPGSGPGAAAVQPAEDVPAELSAGSGGRALSSPGGDRRGGGFG